MKENQTLGFPKLDDPEVEERFNRLAMRIAYKVGDDFFSELVASLAETLNVSHVVISECPKEPPLRARSLAYFANGLIRENIEYDLKCTPCQNAYEEGVFICNNGVRKAFTVAPPFADMGAESYGGISLNNSQGDVVGILCYLNDSGIADSTWQVPSLKWIQARCAAEIERVRLERTRIEQQKMIEESERLASLGTLAAGIAHEINNPLASIRLLLDLGLHESQTNKVMPKQNLEMMVDSVESIAQIVEGVLRISNNQDSKKTKCDLKEILQRACDLTSHESEASQVRVVLEVAEACFVLGNPLELQQVFVNLISNAIQATSESHQKGDVKLSVAAESGNYRVSVSNPGPQIPKGELGRIFEPFYTSRQSDGGTGLGLSISQGIIKAHGGNISVQSNSELTEFTVRIPVSQREINEDCHS